MGRQDDTGAIIQINLPSLIIDFFQKTFGIQIALIASRVKSLVLGGTKMKNLFVLALITLTATSCVSISGNLQVTEKISLKRKGGFLNLGRRNVDIEANDYRAEFKVLGKNNFALKLDRGDDSISIPLKSKEDLKVPTYDGEFLISHNDIDQPFDVKGSIVTDISHSETRGTVESCSWDTRETRCKIECHDVVTRDDRGIERKENKCNKICEDYTISHQGRREVEFHYTTTHRDLRFLFLKANSKDVVAHFEGQNTDTEKIIERTGICN